MLLTAVYTALGLLNGESASENESLYLKNSWLLGAYYAGVFGLLAAIAIAPMRQRLHRWAVYGLIIAAPTCIGYLRAYTMGTPFLTAKWMVIPLWLGVFVGFVFWLTERFKRPFSARIAPFSRRILAVLCAVFAAVWCVILGMTVYFDVQRISLTETGIASMLSGGVGYIVPLLLLFSLAALSVCLLVTAFRKAPMPRLTSACMGWLVINGFLLFSLPTQWYAVTQYVLFSPVMDSLLLYLVQFPFSRHFHLIFSVLCVLPLTAKPVTQEAVVPAMDGLERENLSVPAVYESREEP